MASGIIICWLDRLLQVSCQHTSNNNYTATTPDQAYWKANSNGMFRCSSAWNKIKEKRPKSQFKFLIWHNQIPFKASFLLWRSLNGKLPTNEKLNNFGTVPANCFCCSNRSRTDTINHIFNNGYLTVEVWRSFANMVCVKSDQSSLQQLIAQW